MKENNMRRLERAENTMLRWICGVMLKDRVLSAESMDHLGIQCVEEVVSLGRLRQYRHVEGKEKSDWVLACRVLEVEEIRGK